MKSAIFLLALCCISFALIDPPVQEVDAHNRGIAPQGIQHQNFLNYSAKEPTLGDPTAFFYVKILTLTPSVNTSVASKLQPWLVWLATERHSPTVSEGYDNGHCDRERITRYYDDMKVKSVTAYYSLDGLRKQEGNATVYNTANATVVVAHAPIKITLPNGSITITNGTFSNPSEAPFKRGSWCALLNWFSTPVAYVLGGMINLTCYEESLAYASPYATGAYNFTVRNLTTHNPRLNVTLVGVFTIDYTEHGTRDRMVDGECDTTSWDDNGTITLSSSDSASYEVQNDYMTVVPYLPYVLSLSGNTSENVMYHASLLANSNLYKYYSKMDNLTAGAYYVHSFNVTQDGYGTQFIVATPIEHNGLLPEDNESLNNYTGLHVLTDFRHGLQLKSPTEFNSMSYNYSRIYDFTEVFYNLSNGPHHAELQFYTWFGNYSAPSDINVSSETHLALQASTIGHEIAATCTLTSRGAPVQGQTIELRAGNETAYASTDALGMCAASFTAGAGSVDADFRGTPTLLPSSATATLFNYSPMVIKNFAIGNFALLLLLSGLLALSFLSMAAGFNPFGGGVLVGGMKDKFLPFAKMPGPGKKVIRVKKGKELAVSVAMAIATGGAGGAVAGKVAAEAVAKKAAAEAAKKAATEAAKKKAAEAAKKKMMRELAEKEGRKQKLSAIVKKGKTESPDGWELSRKQSYGDLIKGCKTRAELEKHRGIIKIILHDSHVQTIKEKIGNSCENLGVDPQGKFYKRNVTLHISRDAYLDATLIRDNPFNPAPEKVYAITRRKPTGMDPPNMYEYTIYLRESRSDKALTLIGDGMHENYHPYHKMAWDERHVNQADGFCELMTYEDITTNRKLPKNIRDNYRIVTGPDREYAAQEYLFKEIIGHDHYVVGHLVEGEDYLRQQFEKVSGGVKYNDVFLGDLKDEEKLAMLKEIVRNCEDLNEQRIFRNVKSIRRGGRYEL